LGHAFGAGTNKQRCAEIIAVGHTRLGSIPKTRRWNELVEEITRPPLMGRPVASAAVIVDSIAARTLDAAQGSLKRAVEDTGVRYTFYLLTQIASASRRPDWETVLSDQHGIRLPQNSTLFDLTAELQAAVDRHLSGTESGATDLSEIAQQAAGEAIAVLAGLQTTDLFGGSSSDLKRTIRSISSKKGFGQLGQLFFGRFIARFLNFYLSRVTAAGLGSSRLHDVGDIALFNEALRLHCDQSARIVRDFCGEWYSKTTYEEGIDLEKTSRFLAVAWRKLRHELEQQRAGL
jgi:hypothetical protein